MKSMDGHSLSLMQTKILLRFYCHIGGYKLPLHSKFSFRFYSGLIVSGLIEHPC